ncbi:MAG TPA: hypothetical protein DCG04_19825, partial [Rhodospirillaceae bacterium]|nr:hypothetical protein [Rhodospirillaceae bacterium]
MMNQNMKSPVSPPQPISEEGKDRRVGIEIEFAALKPRDAATLVTQRFGGTVVEVDPHRYEI